MAVTYEQMQAMHALLDADNARECMDAMLNWYAKASFDNAQYLLGKCQKLSEITFMHCDAAKRRYEEASRWLVKLRKFERDPRTILAAMTPVCMALYPEGNADRYCKAEQDFFAEFKALLHNPKAFTWEDSGDWAVSFGYDDYIRRVLGQEEQVNESSRSL